MELIVGLCPLEITKVTILLAIHGAPEHAKAYIHNRRESSLNKYF